MIYFFPIEPLEERYSLQWLGWFLKAFQKSGKPFKVIGDLSRRKITIGEFLDVYDTIRYKARQIAEFLYCYRGEECTIFLMDGWFSGIEGLFYVRDNAKVKIKIKCILHAGTWDPNDFISQNGCGVWAKNIEYSWLKQYDEIFVATNYHKTLIENYFNDKFNITIVDFPVVDPDFECNKKENIVVFPHRLAKEKQPEVFDEVARLYKNRYPNDNVVFIKTKDVCKTKDEYYKLLAKAKVSFSSALQETFGIAMLESVKFGCIPVAPNRLSYPETLANFPLYNTLDEAIELIWNGIHNYQKPYTRFNSDVSHIVEKV
jgi:glycosyltransferase involved in cell wall biosynthesis